MTDPTGRTVFPGKQVTATIGYAVDEGRAAGIIRRQHRPAQRALQPLDRKRLHRHPATITIAAKAGAH